jgi:hypothetical protein
MVYVYCVDNNSVYAIIDTLEIESATIHLKFIVCKPAHAGDSLVDTFFITESESKVEIIEYGPLLIDEYIAGREYTVLWLLIRKLKKNVLYFVLLSIVPEGKEFKTYSQSIGASS